MFRAAAAAAASKERKANEGFEACAHARKLDDYDDGEHAAFYPGLWRDRREGRRVTWSFCVVRFIGSAVAAAVGFRIGRGRTETSFLKTRQGFFRAESFGAIKK